MRAMAILYIGPKRNPDFTTDYYISPILAPAHLLADFPPVLMLCGEKDPFVDDTVIFGGRLREAKRAKRAELLAAAVNGQPSTPNTGAPSNNVSALGLRGEDARLARERALIHEENEEDWVDMRIIEGWGHGFLQMTSGLMLGQKAVNIIDDIADWIGDKFAQQGVAAVVGDKSTLQQHQVNTAKASVPATPSVGMHASGSTGSGSSGRREERRKSSPPRAHTPSLAPSPFDIPPPRHPPPHTRRPSSGASSSNPRTSSPIPTNTSAATNGAIKSRLANSELPPVSSETETELERDSPLTFTVARKNHIGNPNNNITKGKRPSFGSASSGSSHDRPRRLQQQHQSGSSADDTVAPPVGNGSPLPSLSSSTPSSTSPEDLGYDVTSKALGMNGLDESITPPMITATVKDSAIEIGETSSGPSAEATPKPIMSPKPTPGAGGGAALLSQSELMRRRRMEAVFGMGESEDTTSAFPDDEGGSATTSAMSTRSPSPVAMRHPPGQGLADERQARGRAWHLGTTSIDSIDKNANGV